jgi:hypothetical protein
MGGNYLNSVMQPDYVEALIGIAALAVSLAGFTGVVVAFGSRSGGSWHSGDRLRLGFLLEASLTAGGFAILALLMFYAVGDSVSLAWSGTSTAWALFMIGSLYSSRQRIRKNPDGFGDVDQLTNRLVFTGFSVLIVVQILNVVLWQEFAPLIAALCLNLVGAAMQFTRLIRSTFHD